MPTNILADEAQRRRRRTDPTEYLKRLDPRPWPGLDENSKLQSSDDKLTAQCRCRQFIEGGYDIVDS